MEGIVTALTGSFSTVASSLTGVIAEVVPIALPVVGAMVVVTVGIKTFKRIVSK